MRKLLFIFLFLSTGSIFAMLTVPGVAEQQIRNANLVADLQVTSIQPLNDRNLYVVSMVTARVLKIHSIKDDGGWFPREGDDVTILSYGGEMKGVGAYLAGFPIPHLKQKYTATLSRVGDKLFNIAGFDEGLVATEPLRGWTRNRTDGSNGSGTGPYLLWDDSYFPVPFYISAVSMPGHPDWGKAIDVSFQTWRDVMPSRLEFIGMGCSSKTRDANDGVNSVILISNNWVYGDGIIAITRNFYVSEGPKAGTLLDSDILLNGVAQQFTTTNELGKYDIQDIVTHESGHFHGMGHDTVPPIDTNATMYATAAPDETIKRILKTDDLAGLFAGYQGIGNGKKASYVTIGCDIAPPAGSSSSCAAAHDRGGSPWEPVIFISYLISLVATTSVIARRRLSERFEMVSSSRRQGNLHRA